MKDCLLWCVTPTIWPLFCYCCKVFVVSRITGLETFSMSGNQIPITVFFSDSCSGQSQTSSCDPSSSPNYHSSRVQKVKRVEAMADKVDLCKKVNKVMVIEWWKLRMGESSTQGLQLLYSFHNSLRCHQWPGKKFFFPQLLKFNRFPREKIYATWWTALILITEGMPTWTSWSKYPWHSLECLVILNIGIIDNGSLKQEPYSGLLKSHVVIPSCFQTAGGA